ncbi:hypothetical protein [Streptomyces lavendulocolor]|uniref:hypothetical protein n=1 Tax=Streptomyces lavendulocolor TaxID=67316 RepID=UPI003C2CB693
MTEPLVDAGGELSRCQPADQKPAGEHPHDGFPAVCVVAVVEPQAQLVEGGGQQAGHLVLRLRAGASGQNA